VALMPGISLIVNIDPIERSFNILKYEEGFQVNKIIEKKGFNLCYSGFEGYPIFQYLENDFKIIMEGFIYNQSKDEIKEALMNIAKCYVNNKDYREILRQFILKSDGEFIVLIYFPKIGHFLLFNDRWGQLPCYLYHKKDTIIISREVKFILSYLPEIKYNKLALAQYLILRYPLDYRTIFDEIYRIKPCNLLLYQDDVLFTTDIIKLSFQSNHKKLQPKQHYVMKAKDLLFTSIKNRLNTFNDYETKIVDISGGYDSRAVLATIHHLGNKVTPVTISIITGDESHIASQVANTLGYEITHLKPTRDLSFPFIQNVLYKTDGFINGLTAIGGYQDRALVKKHLSNSPIINFMGLGAENFKSNEPLKHPKKFFKTMLDVVSTDIISLSLIKTSCDCLGLKESELINYWNKVFDSTYNEPLINEKVMHYYFDYTNMFVNEGIDRVRIHAWPVCPWMSSELISLALKKIPRKYCDRQFLEQLVHTINPEVSFSRIPHWPPDKLPKSRLYKFIKNHRFSIILTKKYLKRRWRKKAKKDLQRISMEEEILRLYEATETIKEYFSKEGVIRFCKIEYGQSNWYLWQLISLFLYINVIESKFK
jgi:hypothetical protein